MGPRRLLLIDESCLLRSSWHAADPHLANKDQKEVDEDEKENERHYFV